jgi:hypothetical protein
MGGFFRIVFSQELAGCPSLRKAYTVFDENATNRQ